MTSFNVLQTHLNISQHCKEGDIWPPRPFLCVNWTDVSLLLAVSVDMRHEMLEHGWRWITTLPSSCRRLKHNTEWGHNSLLVGCQLKINLVLFGIDAVSQKKIMWCYYTSVTVEVLLWSISEGVCIGVMSQRFCEKKWKCVTKFNEIKFYNHVPQQINPSYM